MAYVPLKTWIRDTFGHCLPYCIYVYYTDCYRLLTAIGTARLIISRSRYKMNFRKQFALTILYKQPIAPEGFHEEPSK